MRARIQARVARHPDEHRQHRRSGRGRRGIVVVGEPQIPLAQLARLVLGAPEGLGHLVGRAQLGHPLTQHRDPPRPADPLGDHRRRHVRRHRQQPADRRLEGVDRRARPSRSYFGASSERSAARTVLRATPSRRAIAFTPIPSARCSRLISAHSSTSITFLLPLGRCRPSKDRVQTTESGGPSGRGVSFRPVIRGQYSGGGDSDRPSSQQEGLTDERTRQ